MKALKRCFIKSYLEKEIKALLFFPLEHDLLDHLMRTSVYFFESHALFQDVRFEYTITPMVDYRAYDVSLRVCDPHSHHQTIISLDIVF